MYFKTCAENKAHYSGLITDVYWRGKDDGVQPHDSCNLLINGYKLRFMFVNNRKYINYKIKQIKFAFNLWLR